MDLNRPPGRFIRGRRENGAAEDHLPHPAPPGAVDVQTERQQPEKAKGEEQKPFIEREKCDIMGMGT